MNAPSAEKRRRRAAALAIALFLLLLLAVALAIGPERWRLHSPERFARALGGEYLGRSGVIFQQATNDCGAAAMKMVFDAYGIERSLATWNAELIDHPRGSSMLRMREVARKWGLEAEGWRVAERDFNTIPLPAIALVNRNHYVVIERIDPDAEELIYADPALGRVRMKRSLFLRKSGGQMLLFRKTERRP
ncbi:MAG: cysteine peptidase family C39 domain-containing protein [Blastocatellia bacterium]|nr:cysteine peptidase family C39 domain-containing protein [Blastocatellia bacterium]